MKENRDYDIFQFLCFGHFKENSWVFIWKPETLALRKIVFPKTGTKRNVLRPFCDEVTFQFTVKCWKMDFLMSSKTRSGETSKEKFRMVRALLPHTPRPPINFNLNYSFFTFTVFAVFQVLQYLSELLKET